MSYFTSVSVPTLNELHLRLTTLNLVQNGWTVATSNSEAVTLCHLCTHSSAATPFVDFTLKVIEDLTWSLYFFDQMIERDACDVLAGIPNSLVSPVDVVEVMDMVNNSDKCIGNPDLKFMPLLTRRNGVFMNHDGKYYHCKDFHFQCIQIALLIFIGTQTVAIHDTKSMQSPTIRRTNCTVLLPKNGKTKRCIPCMSFRDSLRSQLSRLKQMEAQPDRLTNPHSHTPYKYLDREELSSRLRKVHELQVSSAQKVKQLTAKLQVTVEKMGHSVDKEMHSEILQIMDKHKSIIEDTHSPESFQRIFWNQQLKAATCSDSRGMRWHPLMIKWALYLQHQSSGAYETLRSSGCISLPSQRTLRDYTHHVQACTGFSIDVDKQLVNAPEVAESRRVGKKCCLNPG